MAVLFAVLGFGACRIEEMPRTGRPDPEEVAREAIDATRNAYRQALLDGDAAAIGDVFTRDGTLSVPSAPDAVGPDTIEAVMRRRFDHALVTDLLLEPESFDLAAGGIANEWGRFEETVQVASKPPATLRGRYAIRWLRDPDGDWRIAYMLYNLYPYPADTSATR